MRHFKVILKKFYLMIHLLTIQQQLSVFCGKKNILTRSLTDALKETLQNRLASKEQVWVDKIERLREELDSSEAVISKVDYGVGAQGIAAPGQEKLQQDKILTTAVSNLNRASKPYLWSIFLFKLIRKFKPLACIELGTCLGISASYQAAALKLNKAGRLMTLEGAEPLALLAQKHFNELKLDNVSVVIGKFQDTLNGVLEEQEFVDYAFIDGHHDEEATLNYFAKIIPYLSSRAILIFDDISLSDGMRRAWKAIKLDNRVKITIDLNFVGVCIIDDEIQGKLNLEIPMPSGR